VFLTIVDGLMIVSYLAIVSAKLRTNSALLGLRSTAVMMKTGPLRIAPAHEDHRKASTAYQGKGIRPVAATSLHCCLTSGA
jgi:hypothetical protein